MSEKLAEDAANTNQRTQTMTERKPGDVIETSRERISVSDETSDLLYFAQKAEGTPDQACE